MTGDKVKNNDSVSKGEPDSNSLESNDRKVIWKESPESITANPIFRLLVAGATIVGCILAYVGLTSFPELSQCKADLEFCQSRTPRPIRVEVTRKVTEIIYIEITSTSESTPVPSATPTPTAASISRTPKPTPAPGDLIKGTCEEELKPCLYYNALSWQEISIWLYGEAERCRWVEIADLNRNPDGTYKRPLPDNYTVYVPPVAKRGTFLPQIYEGGVFKYIHECSEDQGKPCTLQVPPGITGKDLETYRELAKLAYGVSQEDTSSWWNAQRIIAANFASDCTGDPVHLTPGEKVVIPK